MTEVEIELVGFHGQLNEIEMEQTLKWFSLKCVFLIVYIYPFVVRFASLDEPNLIWMGHCGGHSTKFLSSKHFDKWIEINFEWN